MKAATKQTSKSTDGLFDVHIAPGITCGGRIVPSGRNGGYPYCGKCGMPIREPKPISLIEAHRLLAQRRTLAKKAGTE